MTTYHIERLALALYHQWRSNTALGRANMERQAWALDGELERQVARRFLALIGAGL